MNFASAIACFRMNLPNARREVEMLRDQLLRASTSVAAHVREALLSRSDAELCTHLEGAIQRADESMLCLEMLQEDSDIRQSSLIDLRSEADEIIATFTTILNRIGGQSL